MQNPAFDTASAEYYLQEKSFMFHLFPDGPNKVLDLGCGAGRVGKALLDSKKAAEVIGVEIFELAAAEARKNYKEVHVGDIEEMALNFQNEFDLVVCGDVLEHLKEPEKVVKRIFQWLKPGGLIVCCVPNIRYFKIWAKLALQGQFEYEQQGIMDQTHLRFFTTSSLRNMLTRANFKVEREDMRIAVGPKQQLFNRVTLGVFKDVLGYQILMTARKPR